MDAATVEHVKSKRRSHNRLGWSVQWGTIRMLGTFLSTPAEVPDVVTRFMAEGAVALVDDSFRQAELMRCRRRQVPPPQSGFAGFRFPREVIMLAVRWYLPAPRGASSYPRCSREELEGRFLGLMAYLDAKARGNSSLVRHEAP
jgi:hypothetical protein